MLKKPFVLLAQMVDKYTNFFAAEEDDETPQTQRKVVSKDPELVSERKKAKEIIKTLSACHKLKLPKSCEPQPGPFYSPGDEYHEYQ